MTGRAGQAAQELITTGVPSGVSRRPRPSPRSECERSRGWRRLECTGSQGRSRQWSPLGAVDVVAPGEEFHRVLDQDRRVVVGRAGRPGRDEFNRACLRKMEKVPAGVGSWGRPVVTGVALTAQPSSDQEDHLLQRDRDVDRLAGVGAVPALVGREDRLNALLDLLQPGLDLGELSYGLSRAKGTMAALYWLSKAAEVGIPSNVA